MSGGRHTRELAERRLREQEERELELPCGQKKANLRYEITDRADLTRMLRGCEKFLKRQGLEYQEARNTYGSDVLRSVRHNLRACRCVMDDRLREAARTAEHYRMD